MYVEEYSEFHECLNQLSCLPTTDNLEHRFEKLTCSMCNRLSTRDLKWDKHTKPQELTTGYSQLVAVQLRGFFNYVAPDFYLVLNTPCNSFLCNLLFQDEPDCCNRVTVTKTQRTLVKERTVLFFCSLA